MHIKPLLILGILTFSALRAQTTKAYDLVEIRFKNHRFYPLTLVVPANKALQIKVINLSDERIEFESFRLNREKVVDPGKTVTLNLPALRAGSYDFVDDFHDDVPEGVIIAR